LPGSDVQAFEGRPMADTDPIQPIHEPAVPFLDEEASWVRDAADRFEGARAEELLAWALETFHPRIAISAAGASTDWL